MKKLLLLIMLCAASFSFAQTKVPDKVKSAFEIKFSNAVASEWEFEDGEYSVKFTIDSLNCFAGFTDDGKWTETGTSMSFDNLPDAVKQNFKNNYKDNTIKNVYSVEDSEKQIYYEVDILIAGKTVELYYNKDGSEIDD